MNRGNIVTDTEGQAYFRTTTQQPTATSTLLLELSGRHKFPWSNVGPTQSLAAQKLGEPWQLSVIQLR